MNHFSLQQLALRAWRWRGQMMRGRVAPVASTRCNLAKTLLQTMTMWLVFLVLGPFIVLILELLLGLPWRFDFPARVPASAVLFMGGAFVANISGYFMVTRGDGTPLPSDCPRELVVAGPYKYIRNPMATGSLLQGYAVGLALGSVWVLLYALAGTLGWNYLVRPWEEWDLEQRFGDSYRAYREAVRCWIPRIRPYTGVRTPADNAY